MNRFSLLGYYIIKWRSKCVSTNQRPVRPSDQRKKHKLGRGHWDLASCQVSSNSIQRFQRRSRKCLSQSEAGAAILFFRSAQKTQTSNVNICMDKKIGAIPIYPVHFLLKT